MLICFWTLKGGVGCSVTTAIAGLAHSRSDSPKPRESARSGEKQIASQVTLIDPTGDLAAVLGCDPVRGPGFADWVDAGDDAPSDSLSAAAVRVRAGLSVIGPGTVTLPDVDLSAPQLSALARCGEVVIADAGSVLQPGPSGRMARSLAAHAERSVLVTRACYLALRRAAESPVTPGSVVLLTEAGRALGSRDVEAVVGAPVEVSIAVDSGIARAVDAGLLMSRLPGGAMRALEALR